jgi:hypothetical protein
MKFKTGDIVETPAIHKITKKRTVGTFIEYDSKFSQLAYVELDLDGLNKYCFYAKELILIKSKKFKINDFKSGMKVRYIPTHANHDEMHPDCQDGIVSTIGTDFVFVRYNNWSSNYGSATDPNDLIILNQPESKLLKWLKNKNKK